MLYLFCNRTTQFNLIETFDLDQNKVDFNQKLVKVNQNWVNLIKNRLKLDRNRDCQLKIGVGIEFVS